MIKEPILNEPIRELDFSDEFKQQTARLRLFTLADLIGHEPAELLKLRGFNYRLLTELICFMESEGLGDYIKP